MNKRVYTQLQNLFVLNTYNLFKKEDDNLKKTIIELHNHNNISIPDIIKKSSKTSVNSKNFNSKNKSVRLLKMLNVSNEIISSVKNKKSSSNLKELQTQQKNSIKKWCLDNYLHHKRITKVNKVSKKKTLKPYQVNKKLMSKANSDAIFMHCLPVGRGEEVTNEVIDGKQSVVWRQALNRVHAQKSIIKWCLD